MDTEQVLHDLIWLSHELGREDRQFAILGEGNLSADCGDDTFWVKASGSNLATLDRSGYSRVRLTPIMELLASEDPSEERISQTLKDSLVGMGMHTPSIETFLHAVILKNTQAKFIAHTHPTAVLSILCSQMGAEPFLKHIFPEPVPICGIAPAVIPYVDPGFALGQAVRTSLSEYRNKYQQNPKIMLMINHGLVAIGKTAKDALNISLIADKWANIILKAYNLGGPHYLSEADVIRFAERLDEKQRQAEL